jgi:hypothetical protein
MAELQQHHSRQMADLQQQRARTQEAMRARHEAFERLLAKIKQLQSRTGY